MACYVVSDIHGCLDKFKNLLKKIGFTDEDEMYVLGDICDRGPQPCALGLYLASFPNIVCLIGNHDLAALHWLKKLSIAVEDIDMDSMTAEELQQMQNWLNDGGSSTARDFQKLSLDDRDEFLCYLEDTSIAEEIEVNGQTYVLVHGGLPYDDERDVDEYDLNVCLCRADYTKPAFPNPDDPRILITGHTPTGLIEGAVDGRIYKHLNHVAIDCGAAFGRPLGCLRLDDMQEFYE